MSGPSKRCAIYTRKSTEAGLEQEFNSLHAQREACLAYIKSQKHEGWTATVEEYDDGGFSGGSMDRPALTKLLADVASGRVNIIVVYKVDRLTRSLLDFSKIIEQLDRHGASFVSVTQQFNTTTSMGRLTLNVLLSFAQFEREVTSERIRDKIAASKKKGLWMGGIPPLGYDVSDRELKINAAEAEIVRTIFSTYLDVPSVQELANRINQMGFKTKSWTTRSDRKITGTAYGRGRLYSLLKNPIYIGRIKHKEQTYQGHHEAIVPLPLWTLVQDRLKEQWGERSCETNRKSPCWLVGIMVDDQGSRFKSAQTKKDGRLYYYYVTESVGAGITDHGWRIPAKDIEPLIVSGLIESLRDPIRLLQIAGITDVHAGSVASARAALSRVEKKLRQSSPAELMFPAFKAVRVAKHTIEIDVDPAAFCKITDLTASSSNEEGFQTIKTVRLPVQLRRRGVETRLVISNDSRSSAVRDPKLVQLIARGHVWFDQIKFGQRKSVEEIARIEKVHASDVTRALPIAFLAPSIVEAILAGTHPVELTAERLRRLAPLPYDWTEQRRVLGF